MKSQEPINPCEFIAAVEPLLERRDLSGLHTLLRSRWTCDQIQALLASEHQDARKVAILAMGLVGSGHCVGVLAEQLRDEDSVVTEMAEHALWSIWFRSGTEEANHQLCRGALALSRRDFRHAIGHFTKAIEADEGFAEAYNQRAIAEYLLEEYEPCIKDCMETVERMPCHFGAWAGMGHAHLHMGRPREAMECYERALEIYPRLPCIREAVGELRSAGKGSSAGSRGGTRRGGDCGE